MRLIQKGFFKSGSTKPRMGRIKNKGVGGRSNIVPRTKRVKSISKLMKEADRLWSLKVRNKYLDSGGCITCFTCGVNKPLKLMQNGHYISRSVKFLRWNENNCRPQCVGCNIFKNGNVIEFRIRLVKEIGPGAVGEMESYRHQLMKLTRPYLENLIKELSV